MLHPNANLTNTFRYCSWVIETGKQLECFAISVSPSVWLETIESGLNWSLTNVHWLHINWLSCLMYISLLESQLLRYCACNIWFIKFRNNESLFYVCWTGLGSRAISGNNSRLRFKFSCYWFSPQFIHLSINPRLVFNFSLSVLASICSPIFNF